MNQGLTTRLLHADRLAGVEHGAVHKPLHTAATYGYPTAQALIDVFQGAAPGYVYSRQGNPTGAALEAKLGEHAVQSPCLALITLLQLRKAQSLPMIQPVE